MPCDHGSQPLTFEPIYKEVIWGGRSLQVKLNKAIPDNRLIGESWEISAVSGNESKVRLGPDTGKTLSEIVRRNGQKLVGPRGGGDSFPLLFKFIDAQRDLSIQIHPDDAQARGLGLGDNGKTECWYIIDAKPGATVLCGFKPGVSMSDVKASLQTNRLSAVCNYVPISAGDVIFVPPGTVHATLADTLLFEVQQTSDVTFRMYDWNRVDDKGRPRQLHVEQALSILDLTFLSSRAIEPLHMGDSDFYHAVRTACRYFALEEYRFDGAAQWDLPLRQSFQVLTILQGSLNVSVDMAGPQVFGTGENALIAACAETCHIGAEAGTHALVTYVPDLVSDIIAPLRRLGADSDAIEQLGGGSPTHNDLIPLLQRNL